MAPSAHSNELYCGIDIGASNAKIALVDRAGQLVSHACLRSGVDYGATALRLREAALGARDPGDVVCTVATGYGRHNVSFAQTSATEIHCHGLGCYHQLRQAMVIVDIGAQDNKVIVLGDDGHRRRFRMNRQCASGTGAFLEEIALRLDVALDEFNSLASTTTESVSLSSYCTVFAKTEILAHLRQGASVAALIRGAYESVVDRVLEMDSFEFAVVLTGGVAQYHPAVVQVLARRLSKPVLVPERPQLTGALGAALHAIRVGSM